VTDDKSHWKGHYDNCFLYSLPLHTRSKTCQVFSQKTTGSEKELIVRRILQSLQPALSLSLNEQLFIPKAELQPFKGTVNTFLCTLSEVSVVPFNFSNDTNN